MRCERWVWLRNNIARRNLTPYRLHVRFGESNLLFCLEVSYHSRWHFWTKKPQENTYKFPFFARPFVRQEITLGARVGKHYFRNQRARVGNRSVLFRSEKKNVLKDVEVTRGHTSLLCSPPLLKTSPRWQANLLLGMEQKLFEMLVYGRTHMVVKWLLHIKTFWSVYDLRDSPTTMELRHAMTSWRLEVNGTNDTFLFVAISSSDVHYNLYSGGLLLPMTVEQTVTSALRNTFKVIKWQNWDRNSGIPIRTATFPLLHQNSTLWRTVASNQYYRNIYTSIMTSILFCIHYFW